MEVETEGFVDRSDGTEALGADCQGIGAGRGWDGTVEGGLWGCGGVSVILPTRADECEIIVGQGHW